MKTSIIILIQFFCVSLYSQNLIYNGGFEIYEKCPNDYSQIEIATGWKMPSEGTSDYFNACSKDNICSVPKNASGYSFANKGNAYAGFGFFVDYGIIYEFIQTKLSQPLKVGKIYCLELYVKTAATANYNLNTFSFLFSNYPIRITGKEFYSTAQKEANNFITYKLLSQNKQKWIKISFLYEPKNNEEYLTIGFDKMPEQKSLNLKLKKESYYYIDDISLIEVKEKKDCVCSNPIPSIVSADTIKPAIDTIKKNNMYSGIANKPFILDNIIFATNKSDLLPISNIELDKIVAYFKKNIQYKIELTGHTDNTGTKQNNISLSENRAKSVANYLIKNGIDKTRIKSKGLGSSRPLVPNDTEQNRNQNRRVEIIYK